MTTINLQPTLNLSLDLFERFISDSDFFTKISLAFGEEKAANISPNGLRLALNTLPVIDVRTSEELKGALGAFSAQTGKIYLSESILSDEALTTRVLWEEIGHYLDSYFGGEDAPGDEGEIWRNLVLNQTLTEAELNALKGENDYNTIILDGQEIAIEMAFGTTGFRQFGTSSFDAANGISTDSSGDVYVSGYTFGSLPGNSNSGSLDVFVAKYNAIGTQVWVKQFGSSNGDIAYGISTDSSSNVYVTGLTDGSLPSNSNLGSDDAFVAKYNAIGAQVWVKQFGTSNSDGAQGISTDSSGNVYVTGYTFGSLSGNSNLGNNDAFVAKYNGSGNQVWVKQFGTSNSDGAQGISTDSSGNVYVTGYTFGSLSGNSNLGNNDAFVAKYNSSGNQLWVKQFGSSSDDYAQGTSTDSSGNVYVTGQTSGTLPGNSNSGIIDAFVAKYDASGTQLWVKQFGTSSDDIALGISTDSSGNIYVAGLTGGSLPGNNYLGGISDAFVAKYNGSGTQLWVKQFGTSSLDAGGRISTDISGNVYVSGLTYGSLPGNSNLGDSDAFVVGFDANGNLLNTPNPLPTDPLTSPVYRFYNAQSKGHFFTTNTQERDTVLANPQWGYTYEVGFGFKASTSPGQNLLEVFRFYNAQSRGHFFTTNVQERDTVLANPQWGYTYEAGLGFYAYGIDANLGSDVYRFYNAQSKGHFFTLDPSERDTVLANPQWGYTYEAGLGFEASFA